MTRTLLLLAAFGSATILSAQSNALNTSDSRSHAEPLISNFAEQAAPQGINRMAPFWTEDFSGGIPAGWASVDLTSNPGEEVNFVHETDATVPAAFSYGAYTDFSAMGASNGFVWANSDRGLTAAPGTNHVTEFTTTAIDCSAEPTVLLTMQTHIGVFDLNADTNAIVQVSNDGVNWVNFQLFPCLVTGSPAPPCVRWSDNPEAVEVDITSVAGSQATVYLRFQWTGGWEYYWCIDDIGLSAVPPFERDLLFSVISHAGDGYEYARVPEGQLDGNMELGMYMRNFGVGDQTNLVLSCDITDASSTSVLFADTTVAVVVQNDTAIMDKLVADGALTAGAYTATFASVSDQEASEDDLTDNGEERNFEITGANGLYSLDGLDVYANPTLSSLSTASFTDGADGFMIFTKFRISNQATFEGAEAVISTTGTVPGGDVQFGIHNALDVAPIDPAVASDVSIFVAQSSIIEVTQQHVDDGRIGAAFTFPAALAPGDYYLSITMNSLGNTFDIRVLDDATVPQPGDAGLIFIAGASGGVFSNGNAPALRLSADASIGLEEVSNELAVQIGPNPTNDVLNIRVAESGNTVMSIFNTTGQLVMTDSFNGNTVVNVQDFAAGTYSVQLINGSKSIVEQITVK